MAKKKISPCSPTPPSRIERLETLYLAGFALLQTFTSLVQPYLLPASLRARYTFLPLLLTSVYCSAGLWWSWARLALASVRASAPLAAGPVLEPPHRVEVR